MNTTQIKLTWQLTYMITMRKFTNILETMVSVFTGWDFNIVDVMVSMFSKG